MRLIRINRFSDLIILLVVSLKGCGQELDYTYSRKDPTCDPVTLGLLDYTGYRIQHQVLLSSPPQHFVRICSCKQDSHIGADAYRPVEVYQAYTDENRQPSRDVILAWNKKICTMSLDRNICFKLARSREYAIRELPFANPGDVIGALYFCPGMRDDDDIECTDDNSQFIDLLVADDPFLVWRAIPDNRHIVDRYPIAATKDSGRYGYEDGWYDPRNAYRGRGRRRLRNGEWFSNWFSKPRSELPHRHISQISVAENYTYTDQEVELAKRADSKVRRRLHVWHNGSKLSWWSFGKLVPKDYSGLRDVGDGILRRPVENLVSGVVNATAQSVESQLAILSSESIPPYIAMLLSLRRLSHPAYLEFVRFADTQYEFIWHTSDTFDIHHH
ncbi:hypothetical protein TRVA0_020S00386 [Trichomonascus vanleenenianus]|uniref:uncharacterized protein n=1 Tax=Trichomonascus vanleenenianus TaxID=2268995 RepID=UPI003ECB3CA8